MRKSIMGILTFLCVAETGMAIPSYYTYEGVVGHITGNSELLTQQDFNIGDDFMCVIMVDFERRGESTRNNGDVVYRDSPTSFYADLITSTPFEAIDGGSHNGASDFLEHNYCDVVELENNTYGTNGYIGSGDAYIHITTYSPSDTPFNEWEMGHHIEMVFTVFDSSGASAAGYTYGVFTSISESNPIPAPSALLLAGIGVGCVSCLRRRKSL